MNGRKWAVLILTLLLLAPSAGRAAKKGGVKTERISETWLCAGAEAPVRESPKETAAVLWTLHPDQMIRTNRHLDQYYQLTAEDGQVGYVSKGAVRICNPQELTAGNMFKLPHVAPQVPRLPAEPVMAQAVVSGENAVIFLAKEGCEEPSAARERVYVFSAYGSYAAVWHRGRLGYIFRRDLSLLRQEDTAERRAGTGAADASDGQSGLIREESLEAYAESLDTADGTIRENPILTQAIGMLEAGNPIVLRYEKLTGQRIETLFSAGVPYFWGGQDGQKMLERWPEYTTREQWQGSNEFYLKGSIYVLGLDCVGFIKTVFERAGVPLKESLNGLGSQKHCRAGDHVFCSEKNPFPEDWQEAAAGMEPGDLLALHHPGRHAMLCIGTLRAYGYTEEQLPALAEYLDYPLMIHSGENPLAFHRFSCLTARSKDSRVSKALGSDGGVSLCILGVPREEAETTVTCHEKTYACFDVEGACVTVFHFGNVKDYYVIRSKYGRNN